jgi:uncharacterized protein YecE (DUF72 family)
VGERISADRRGRILVGISGWRYEPWRGVFYPPGLAQDRELAYASRALPTIEINGTFYSLQRPAFFDKWYAQTPPGFVFAVKGSRFITHMLKLRGIDRPLANFFASGIFGLREKLGPFLWQFPPNFRFDASGSTPSSASCRATRSGALPRAPARRAHDGAMPALHRRGAAASPRGRGAPRELRRSGLRGAPSKAQGGARRRRHRRQVAVSRRRDRRLRVRAPARRGGALRERIHRGSARSLGGANRRVEPRERARDARRISDRPPPRRARRDVYCYFDNDIKVKAPFDAKRLIEKLGLGTRAFDWHRRRPYVPESPRSAWPQ